MKHPTFKRGWYCKIKTWPHDGPCPMVPKWWNLKNRKWR